MAKKFTYKTARYLFEIHRNRIGGRYRQKRPLRRRMSREYPGNRSADARDAGCRRDRTSRRHRLQRPGNILSRPAGKGVGVRPSDNNGYDETRERSGSPKSGETKEKQKQLYRQSHRSRKWRCRCLSVARPDCGNGRLNEKESAAHPGRGKSRNLFGKIR